MSMFCGFLLSWNDISTISGIILNKIVKGNVIRLYEDLDTIRFNNEDNDVFEAIFDAFSISIDLLDNEDSDYKSSEYNMDLKIRIYFDIFHDVHDWEMQLFRFLGCLMKNIACDCVFEYCSDVTFIKKSGKIIVDESRTGRLVKFPYAELDIDYFEGKIDSNMVL